MTLLLLPPFITTTYAKEYQQIDVAFEPFPPLINEDGSGLVIDMLNSLEQSSKLHFNFHLMTYARAKHELKNNRVKVIGLTPQNYETSDFYQYAQDLKWNISANVDFFSLDKSNFDTDKLADKSIGTLMGNADFFSVLLNIPRNKFIEVSSLEQLAKLLSLKRLSVVVFERVSMMKTINKIALEHVYYKKFILIAASLAVANNEEGNKLKKELDDLIDNIDNNDYFSEYFKYLNLPDQGTVLVNKKGSD
jgi:polar amino acid transport system substrate-binding protein